MAPPQSNLHSSYVTRAACAAFVNENNHLDPILAFQKAIAVPRNHVASTFKASWQSGHDSLFNSQFNSNMFSTVGSLTSVPTGQSIALSSRLRAGGARSMAARSARKKGPVTKTSHFMHGVCIVLGLLALAYLAVRVWDAAELYMEERRWGRLFYRCWIVLMEMLYAAATLVYLRLATKFASPTQPRRRCVLPCFCT